MNISRAVYLWIIAGILIGASDISYAVTIGRTAWTESEGKLKAVLPCRKTSEKSASLGTQARAQGAQTAIAADTQTISCSYTFDAPVISRKSDGYDEIKLGTLEPWIGKEGSPKLPARTASILVPYGRKVTGINIVPGLKTGVNGSYTVEPASKMARINQIVSGSAYTLKADPIIYGSTETYPSVPVADVQIQNKSGYTIVLVNLFPVQYIPAERKLTYYKNIGVEVETEPCQDTQSNGVKLTRDDETVNYIAGMVDNSDAVASYGQGADTSAAPAASMAQAGESGSFVTGAYDYVIITSASIRDSAMDYFGVDYIKKFIDWRKDKNNITVYCATFEDDIYPAYLNKGLDQAAMIREYIKDCYNRYGTKYVLLAGTKHLCPGRLLSCRIYNVDGEGGYLDELVPSDLYYACLDGSFDGNGNGVYGESDDGDDGGDIDLLPEVYIGRILVENQVEWSHFVDKTIAFEKYGMSAFFTQIGCMLGECLGFGGISDYATPMMEQIRMGSSDDGYTTVGFANSQFGEKIYTTTMYQYLYYDSNTDTYYPSYGWTGDDLYNDMNKNRTSIYNHLGHSNWYVCMDQDSHELESCLSNIRFFFIYSQGCSAGQFDITNKAGDRCFADIMTAKSRGAYAVVMNTRSGWGAGNSTDGSSQRLNRYFWDAALNKDVNMQGLGRMNQYSKEKWAGRTDDCDGTLRYVIYAATLFGDPAAGVMLFEAKDANRAIISPGEGAHVGGDVSIAGDTGSDAGFNSYELYVLNTNGAEVYKNTSTTPVHYGVLGIWESANSPYSNYAIYLKVNYNDGKVSQTPNVMVTKGINTGNPDAPTGLKATVEEYTVKLNWYDTNQDETGFVIQRMKDGTQLWDIIHESGPNIHTYTDDSYMEYDTVYFYRVMAGKNNLRSEPSNNARIRTNKEVLTPELTSWTSEGNSIKLNFKNKAKNATRMLLQWAYKATEFGSNEHFVVLENNVTEYTIVQLEEGETILFRLRAEDEVMKKVSDWVGGDAYVKLKAPTSLAMRQYTTHEGMLSINFTWKDNSQKEDCYWTPSSSYPLSANITTFTLQGLPGDYGTSQTFMVRASNASLDKYSDWAVLPYVIGVPNPVNVKATGITSSQINVQWAGYQVFDKLSQYIIERSDSGTYPVFNFQPLATMVGTEYCDNGLIPDKVYYYRIKRRYNGIDSAYSSIVAAKTPDAIDPNQAPKAPSEVYVDQSGENHLQPTLYWKDNSDNEDGFRIECPDLDNGGTIVQEVARDRTVSGPLYQSCEDITYTLYAYNRHGKSSAVTAKGHRFILNDKVPAVYDFEASIANVEGMYYPVLEWSCNAPPVDDNTKLYFLLQRSTDGKTWRSVGELIPKDFRSFMDITAPQGAKCYYRIFGIYEEYHGMGAWYTLWLHGSQSSVVSVITGFMSPVLEGHATPSSVELSWTNPDGSAPDGFRIERSIKAEGPFIAIAEVNMPNLSYSDTSSDPCSDRYYRVSGMKNGKVSPIPSGCIIPVAPSDLVISQGGCRVDWKVNTSLSCYYKIERATSPDFNENRAVIIAAPKGTTGYNMGEYDICYISPAALRAQMYYFRVSALDAEGEIGYCSPPLYSATGEYIKLTSIAGESAKSNTATAEVTAFSPLMPTAYNARPISSNSVSLTWAQSCGTSGAGANVVNSFSIYRAKYLNGPYYFLCSVAGDENWISGGVKKYQYVDNKELCAKTPYYYKIGAKNWSGEKVTPSFSVTTTPDSPRPYGVKASLEEQNSVYKFISLTWSCPAGYESYNAVIEASPDGRFDPNDTKKYNCSLQSRNYPRLLLPYNQKYYFMMYGVNGPDRTPYSDVIEVCIPDPLPDPVSELTAAPAVHGINLSWVYPEANNADGFYIERSMSDTGPFENIAVIPFRPDVFSYSYSDIGLSEEAKHYYRVSAYRCQYVTAPDMVSAVPLMAAPAAPGPLKAETVSNSQADLTWTDNAFSERGFLIDASRDSTFISGVSSYVAAKDQSAMSIGGLNAYTTYYFRIRAYNNGGNSAYSNVALATTWGNTPGGVTGLCAPSAFIKSDSVRLYWNYNSTDNPGITAFRVDYKKSTDASFTMFSDQVQSTARICDITGLGKNTVYTFQVRAYMYGPAYSPGSAIDNVKTLSVPPNAPSELTAELAGDEDVILAWTDISADEDRFIVERKVGVGNWEEIPNTNILADMITYCDSGADLPSGLQPGTQYSYRLRAYSSAQGAGYSEYSNEAAVTMPKDVKTFDIDINSRGTYTPRRAVSIVVSSAGDTSGLQIRYSNDTLSWTGYETYISGQPKDWNLSLGNGMKTVYAQLKEASGVENPIISYTIELNYMKPLMAADINNDLKDDIIGTFMGPGVFVYSSEDGSWHNLSGAAAAYMAKRDKKGDGIQGKIAADFPGFGVWVRTPDGQPDDINGCLCHMHDTYGGTWHQITPVNSQGLETGDINNDGLDEIIGVFPEYGGLYAFMNGQWVCLNLPPCRSMIVCDVDNNGYDDIVADFKEAYAHVWAVLYDAQGVKGYEHMAGVACEWLEAGYVKGDNEAEILGDFGGIGLWMWDYQEARKWQKISDADAQALVMADVDGDGDKDVLGQFAGHAGVYRLLDANNGSWSNYDAQLDESVMENMVSAEMNGTNKHEVIFDISGLGIYAKYDDVQWQTLAENISAG